MIITDQLLIELEACEPAIESFRSTFGPELKLPTELEAQKALVQKLTENSLLDLLWCEEKLFKDWQYELYLKKERDNWYLWWGRYQKNKESPREYRDSCWLAIIQILTETLEDTE